MNTIKKLLFLLLLLSLLGDVSAQTEPMYSQYMFNMLSINPAYAGNREALSLNTFHRSQWVGLPGAPRTTSVSIDGAINDNRIGLGLQLYDDRLGVERATGANTMVSARIHLSDRAVLSGGLMVGMMNYRANLMQVSNRITQDDRVFGQNYEKWMPTVGAGIFYNTDHFYAGISVPNVLRSRLSDFDVIASGIQMANDFHVFVNLGMMVNMGEDVKVKPSLMLKSASGAPYEADINLNIWLKDMFGIGASYRTGDAVIGMVEMQATKQFRIGYAYDMTLSELKAFNSGSHELMLRFEFSRKQGYKSTRFF
jgi:type IX secretion system PorP/SprF family membrane protein